MANNTYIKQFMVTVVMNEDAAQGPPIDHTLIYCRITEVVSEPGIDVSVQELNERSISGRSIQVY